MKRATIVSILVLLAFLLAACGATATRAPENRGAPATQPPAAQAPAATQAPAAPAEQLGTGGGDNSAQQGIEYGVGGGKSISSLQSSNRMIIKNGDLLLQVKDVDVAIDGVTQAVGDLGGYIVSSRVWYQDTNGKNMKYTTITLGVPVDQFENMLRRLRNLSVKVLDESATGEDVTDQFVDLQSQLQNLQATRDRLRDFLKDAKTVDEALKVNQELTNIEGQIEEIQGRMNYLQNRSAYSTITVTLQPVPPEFTPTPTATPTLTPTPTATSTPVPWKPGETFSDAGRTLSTAYKGIGNFLIWMFAFVLPIIAPPVLILWAIWYFARRKTVRQKASTNAEK
jgi:hypothetical protein